MIAVHRPDAADRIQADIVLNTLLSHPQGPPHRTALLGYEFSGYLLRIKAWSDLHHTLSNGHSTLWTRCLTYVLDYKLPKDKNYLV